MGSGVSRSKQTDDPLEHLLAARPPTKELLSSATANGAVDPRITLGRRCSPDLAEMSDAFINRMLKTRKVCSSMSAEQNRDVAQVTAMIDTTSAKAILKDRIEIAKNIAFNIGQKIVWGDQFDFVSNTRHRAVPQSVQFKLNYEGALERARLRETHDRKFSATLLTCKQTPASAYGRFPVCVHYWWKSSDLLAIILNFVPLQQLGKVSLVHKAWYDATKKIRDVVLTKPIPGDRILEAQSYFNNPTTLRIESMYNVRTGAWLSLFTEVSWSFKQLSTLILKDCSSIVDEDIIPIFEHCVTLESVTLAALAGLVRPKIMSSSLKSLVVEDCVWLEEIAGHIPSIVHVSLMRLNCLLGQNFDRTCMMIGIIDENSDVSKLKSISFKQCNGVTDIVVKNQSVESIRVLICGSLKSFTVAANKATLLTISQCFILSSLAIRAPLLERVVIQDMRTLRKADIVCPLAEYACFQDIHHTTNAVLEQGMDKFEALKSCRISSIGSANRLPFGPNFLCFRLITTLFIAKCALDDTSLAPLQQFENLKHFEMWECSSLACARFAFSRSLEFFSCNLCASLFSIDLNALGLHEAVINKCYMLKDMNVVTQQLSNLIINQCQKISTLHLESDVLHTLELDDVHGIEFFTCRLPALEMFRLKHAHQQPSLETIQAVFQSKCMHTVTFEDLSGFSDFDIYRREPKWSMVRELNLFDLVLQDSACNFIQNMAGLQRLCMRHCNSLVVARLVGPPKLTHLEIEACSVLNDIVISAPNIKVILVKNCPRLLSVSLGGPCLEQVSFHETNSLFMINSDDGGPALKQLYMTRSFDVQVICETFCKAPELLLQIRSKSYTIMMGELQRRRIVET